MSGRPATIEARENRQSLALRWLMVLVCCAMLGGANYVLFFQRGVASTPLWAVIVLCVFSLIGMLLIWATLHATIELARFGTINLEILAPAAIGGRLSAAMKLPAAAKEAPVLGAEFACLHKCWRKTHDRRSSNEIVTEKHRERREFQIQWAGDHGRVALQFGIPPGLPHSEVGEYEQEDDPARGFHYWELRIEASVAGVDLARTYPVLVAPAVGNSAQR